MNMDWARNITLIMKTHGASTVLTIWFLSITAVGIFGNENTGGGALILLLFTGGIAATTLVKLSENQSPKHPNDKDKRTSTPHQQKKP